MSDLLAPLEAGGHDPGGRRMRPLPFGVVGDAVFGGPNDCYRYRLSREWPIEVAPARTALLVMMNPSMANPLFDDPTVFKIWKMVQRWTWRGIPHSFGRMLVGNVFAYRSTDQRQLARVEDPIGPDNDGHLLDMARVSDIVVFAYGKPCTVALRQRGPAVMRAFREAGIEPAVLRLADDGSTPWHPLFLPDTSVPITLAGVPALPR